jgi:D-sedoheptulose 7-phosphate isomerase
MIDAYLNKLTDTLDKISREEILKVADVINTCEGNIFVFGNGGSAATASHFAQDMNKELNLRFICLTDNTPSILAYGNDIGFDFIFEQQLARIIKIGDVVIGISCSGNSMNVLKAIMYANDKGCTTIGITGFDGGGLVQEADYSIHVPSHDMQVCEDCHLIIAHTLLKLFK